MKMTHGKSGSLSRIGGHVIEDIRGVFTGGATSGGDGIDGSNARETVQLQVKRFRARMGAGGTMTGGEDNRNTGGRRIKMPKDINGSLCVIDRKKLSVADGRDVSGLKTLLELAKTVATSGGQERGDVHTREVGAGSKLKKERIYKGRIERHVDNIFIGEGR